MNVLFLALGASRRRVIVTEAAQVIAAGGTATVLVREPAKWQHESLPAGADMVELSRLLRDSVPALPQLLFIRIPRFLIRVCLRGPLSGFGARVRSFHQRRVVRPLTRFHQRRPTKTQGRVFHRDLLSRRSIDLVVVGDAESMVTASELRDVIASSGAGLAYTAGHQQPAASNVRG